MSGDNNEAARNLTSKLLKACDGYDGATVIAAMGAAAATAVFYGIVDPELRQRTADYFVKKFQENIKMLTSANPLKIL